MASETNIIELTRYHGSDKYVHATPEPVLKDVTNYGTLDSNVLQYIQEQLAISVSLLKLLF